MMKTELTSGSVSKNIIRFSLPFLLSYFLQTLYGLADLYIIGKYNGVSSTTSVSIGSQVMHMITVMIVGLAMGSTVVIGKAVGAKQKDRLSRAIGNTVTLFLAMSIILAIALLLLVRPIAAVMSTPQEAFDETVSYLTICFIGVPFITAYNIISSIFRGLGDSKSPMYFIAIACASNIILDFVFIGYLGFGAAGAALGTTVSQAISVVISLIFIRLKSSRTKIKSKDLKLHSFTVKEILKIGAPISLQDGFIQIAFLVITIIANQRGLNDAAAVGVVEKIIGILFLVPSSMLSSVSVLCAQNNGAGKHERSKLTLRYALIYTIGFGLVAAVSMQFLAESAVGIFTSEPEVIRLGAQYMRGYAWDCVVAGIHFCFSGYFCAYGLSIVSFIHNCASILLARIPLAYLASLRFPDTLFPMGIATTTGSVLSVIICICFYIWMGKHYDNIKLKVKTD